MSGLYEAIFKRNPQEKLLLKMLHLDTKMECIGRYRDIYLNADGTKIILYTRNGGGNRVKYQWVFDDFKKLHPYYVRDWDDAFDETYAYVEFNVPPEFKKEAKELATGKDPVSIGDKFQQLFRDQNRHIQTEDTQRAEAVGKIIAKQINDAIARGESKFVLIDEFLGDLVEKN